MDRIDILNLLVCSFIIAYLANLNGVELVVVQTIWFSLLWLGKWLVDRWIQKQYT